MRNQKLILITSLIGVFLLSMFIVLKPQAQNKTNIQQKTEKQKDSFPKASYLTQDALNEKRKLKNKKYDKGIGILSPSLSKDDISVSSLDWAANLPALPINASELVVLGKVVNANAYLSNSKNTVYSEFKIAIETVFKNGSKNKHKDREFVIVEREGGIVEYPSGYEHWHFVNGQSMPLVNNRYVFFLTHDFQIYGNHKNSFYLLTAYELREGKVIPLDNPGDFYPIASFYKEKDETSFLVDLQTALQD